MPPEDTAPRDRLMQLLTGKWVSYAIHAIVRLGIPDLLGEGGASIEDLARASGAQPALLARVLRALASVGLFSTSGDGRISLTPSGALLRSGPASLRDMALMVHLEMDDRAWQHLSRALTTGAPAFEEAHGVPVFEWLARHPEDAATFSAAMAGYAELHHVAVARDSSFAGSRTLVDVGGGDGILACAILAANTSARGIVLDLPHVVERARRRIAEMRLDGRCSVAEGNFLEAVPAGDTYLVSHILHNWGDDDCVTILRNCCAAMEEGGRILVVEALVPEGDQLHFSKVLDLAMLVWNRGGRERTEDEYRALFDRAGLELARVTPTGDVDAILEAVPRVTRA